jgi:hypothetical protein
VSDEIERARDQYETAAANLSRVIAADMEPPPDGHAFTGLLDILSPVKVEVPGRFLNLLAPSRPWTCSLHETSLAAGERCQACLDEHAARSLTANDE